MEGGTYLLAEEDAEKLVSTTVLTIVFAAKFSTAMR
jgi:hypothetical protein